MKRIFEGIQQAFGAEGCPFGPRVEVVIQSGDPDVVIPAGVWLVETDHLGVVVMTYDAGSSFVDIIPPSGAGMIFSDGFNVFFRNDDGAPTTCHRTQLLALA